MESLIHKFIFLSTLFGIICLVNSCKKGTENLPIVTTTVITGITHKAAVSGGSIVDDKGLTISERGVCWSTNITPTIKDNKSIDGSGAGSYSSNLTGLKGNTIYYVRAYATNASGTGYGMALSFTTNVVVIDADGNEYPMVTIGTQVWMAENLKTTKYNNGDVIPIVTDNSAWTGLTTGAYCFYNNDITNKNVYGAMYNWYAVNTGKLCPTGWHVSSQSEIYAMLGVIGSSTSANKLREVGTSHWTYNSSSTNQTGFTALPGGLRVNTGTYGLGTYGYWWLSDELNTTNGYYSVITYDGTSTYVYGNPKYYALSVRCVKN